MKNDIFDTISSEDFDHITRLAARLCGCKISLIGLLGPEGGSVKSCYGANFTSDSQDTTFCAYALKTDGVFIVENTDLDERFAQSALVVNGPFIKFYAGIALVTANGQKIGTLCVFDTQAKSLSQEQMDSLADLAKVVVGLLHTKSQNKELDVLKRQYEDVQSMSHTGGWQLDLVTNKTTWSKEVYEIHKIPTGKSPDKVDAISFYATHERERLVSLIEKCAVDQIEFDEVFEFYDSEGLKKWVRSIGKPVREKDGSVRKLIGTFQDITDQKNDQLAILEKNKEIENSHTYLDLALEGAKVGIWDWNLEKNVMFFDARWAQILGLDSDDMKMGLGDWEQRVHPDDLDSRRKNIDHYLKGFTDRYENIHRMKHEDGHWIYILEHGRFSQWDDDGNPTHFTGTHLDVTEAKRREFELDLVLRSARVGIWKFNPQTSDLYWDESMYELYDVSASDFSGAYDAWEKTLDPDFKESAVADLERALAGHEKFDTTFAILTRDGSRKYIGARAEIERDKDGLPIMMTGINWDRTQEHLAIIKNEQAEQARLEELELILESTPSCLKIITKDGRLFNMNTQGLSLIEAPDLERVLGANVYDIVEESHRDKFIAFNEYICAGNSGSLIFEMIGLEGTRRWMETYAAPYRIKNDDHEEIAHIAITNDISDRIKAKQEFEKLLEDYKEQVKVSHDLLGLNEEILNTTNDGILLVCHNTKTIKKYNKLFLDMWGVGEDLESSLKEDFLREHALTKLCDPKAFSKLIEQLYKTPEKESFDVVEFLDGRIFERYSNPLIIDGEVEGRLWFFRDISEKKEMEKIVNHTSKLAAIGQLAAGVGHEINNPLAIIKGYVATIQKRLSDETQESRDNHEALKKINLAADRIANIVSGLRTFARLEKEGNNEAFNVKGLLFEMENMLKEIYNKEGVSLAFHVDQLPEKLCINGKRGMLEQVLVNLINNGRDASEGQEERKVVIHAESIGHEVKITVTDNGQGIAPHIQEKIFDPFYTTKDVGKGTGIGLSLVHKYINNDFCGSVKLESTEGEGTSFILHLPAVYSFQCIEEDSHAVDGQEQYHFSLRGMVVDDEEDLCELLQDVLEDLGIEVDTFTSGKLALDHYQQSPYKYDFIISDMKMPDMDGAEFLSKVCALDKKSRPKLFISTGGVNVDLEDENNVLSEMIDGFFYKPFDETQLIKKLEEAFPHSCFITNKINKKSAS